MITTEMRTNFATDSIAAAERRTPSSLKDPAALAIEELSCQPAPRRRGRPTAVVPNSMFSVRRDIAEDGALVLRTRGRLDVLTALPFRDAVFGALGERPSLLEINLEEINLLEAAGINSLLTVIRVARLVGVPYRVRASGAITRLLETTRLAQLFNAAAPTGEQMATKILARA